MTASPERGMRRRVARSVLVLSLVGILAAATAIALGGGVPASAAPHGHPPSAAPAPAPASAAVVPSVSGHDHAHAEPAPEAAPASGRLAQLRVRDGSGALLASSWPGEDGPLEQIDPAENASGPFLWKGPEGLVGRQPLWEPLVPLITLAPPGTTVRVQNYTVPTTKLEELRWGRTLEVPMEGSVPVAQAETFLGKNVTEGKVVYFLAQIPLRILHVGAEEVTYRFELDAPLRVPVLRSVGLEATVTPIEAEEKVRFAFDAPTGAFTAHNNCLVLTEYLPPGYYVVRAATEEELVLDRYNTQVDHILEGARLDVEVAFLDGLAS